MPTVAARVEVPIEGLEISAYTIPTEEPEADGTLEWDGQRPKRSSLIPQ
jgi:hypothetical protein